MVNFLLLKYLIVNLGIELDTHIETPHRIDSLNFKGKKVVDFDLGENVAIILLGRKNYLKICEKY